MKKSNLKKIYKSKTIISAIYLLAVLVLPVIKEVISEQEIIDLSQLVMGVLGVIGVIYGRIKATDNIKF